MYGIGLAVGEMGEDPLDDVGGLDEAMTRSVRGIVNLTALAVAQVDAVSRPSPG